MYTTMRIEYADPLRQYKIYPVDFRLRDHAFVPRWIERVEKAKNNYPIDDPTRFYGFGPIEHQQELALLHINSVIDLINQERDIIWRRPESVYDQDCLNYLHHIFELYHGLLDQSSDKTSQKLHSTLSRLNILIHRCESIARGANPRHVVTWFGLPKDKLLMPEDYALFTDEWNFGTVFLNYAEIGKTIEDLYYDNDKYISDGAFQPYKHYSADFNVKYYATDANEIKEKRVKIIEYYNANKDRFGAWNASFVSGSIPLADVITKVDLNELEMRQRVKSIQFR